jgi:hypothetical protein
MSHLSRIVYGATMAVAAAGLLGTLFVYSLVMFQGGYGGVEFFLFFSVWDSWPYGFMALLAYVFRRRLPGALLVLLGSLAVTGWGLWLLRLNMEPYFIPRSDGHRLMNCAGPIVEIMLPIMQGVGVGVVGGLAALLQGAFNELASAPRL